MGVLRPEISQLSSDFGKFPYQITQEKLEKKENSTGENSQNPVEAATQNCKILGPCRGPLKYKPHLELSFAELRAPNIASAKRRDFLSQTSPSSATLLMGT